MEKSPEELYREREKRVNDAIQLKVPDRIPFFPFTHFFAVKYTGMTFEEAFYDPDKFLAANKKMNMDLEPDLYFPPVFVLNTPGQVLEALDVRVFKWPGHGVSPYHTHQFVEGEYIKADEYDTLLKDPSDFLMRTILPRVCGALESFRTLPPLRSFRFSYLGIFLNYAVYGMPEVGNAFPEAAGAFESVLKAGREMMKWGTSALAFDQEMRALGFPALAGGFTGAPFDLFSFVRGMRGSMLDMYRQPDKLLEVMERMLPRVIWAGVTTAKMSGNPRVFMGLHRGTDSFMSTKQFETFYWPTLKRLTLALIDEGLIPFLGWEEKCDQRLEYLTELPKGKVICFFAGKTDVFKAKEILGNNICIAGNMPISLLQTGTPQQVKDYAKRLIDVVGKDGGFIMCCSSVMDEADPELVKVWADFTKEYGVYR